MQTDSKQALDPQSSCSEQSSPASQRGQSPPPQSTSVSSPFLTESVQPPAEGATEGAELGELER